MLEVVNTTEIITSKLSFGTFWIDTWLKWIVFIATVIAICIIDRIKKEKKVKIFLRLLISVPGFRSHRSIYGIHPPLEH